MTLDLAKLRELQDRAAAIEGVPLLSREWVKAIGVLQEAVFAQLDTLLTAAEEFDKHRLSAAHWEDLAAKYKTERDEARAECERLRRDAERYEWLCADLDSEQRAKRSHIFNRMSVMGKGAIDAAIDAASAEGER